MTDEEYRHAAKDFYLQCAAMEIALQNSREALVELWRESARDRRRFGLSVAEVDGLIELFRQRVRELDQNP